MITHYYKSLRSNKVQELDGYKPGCWVHVEAPGTAEIAQLTKRFGLVPGHLEDALDEDEVPRLEKEGEQTYIFVRFALRDGDGGFVTVPLLIIVGKDLLITVSRARLPSLD